MAERLLERLRPLSALAALAAAAVIAHLSLAPPGEVSAPPISDKLLHFIAYGGLGGLAAAAAPMGRRLLAWGGATVYGAGLEIAQGLGAAGREASVLDAAANAAGAGAGVLALIGLARLFDRGADR